MRAEDLTQMQPCPAKSWYAVSTIPRHEKSVNAHLMEREIETFYPFYCEQRQWKKRAPVVLDLPLFPTYMFIRIQDQERGRVLGVPGVLSIVGNRRQALMVPDAEIEALRRGLSACSARPAPCIAVGERVRIVSGSMAGMQGLMVRSKNQFRVVISIEMIMKSISVEIDLMDIEPLLPAQLPAQPYDPQAAPVRLDGQRLIQ